MTDTERERDFYRQQSNDLGRRLLRLQEEENRARRAARRNRTAATLIREAYNIADLDVSMDEIGRKFIQIILNILSVDRAAVFEFSPDKNCFIPRYYMGFSRTEKTNLDIPVQFPEFCFANSRSPVGPVCEALCSAAGAPYLLWAFNPQAKLALLVANSTEDQHLHCPFEEADREIIEGALNVFIAIKERKQIEKALRASERKYRELVENANSIIMRMDTDGRVMFFNEFAQDFFGYREKEILGQYVVGSIVPEFESTGRNLSELMANICGDPENFPSNENENIRKDGSIVRVAWTNRAVYDAEGKNIGVLCVGNDITELMRIEAALRESEANYHAVFDSINDAIFIHDIKTGDILDVNKKMCEMFGYNREDVCNRNIEVMSAGKPPHSQKDAMRWIRRAAGGEPQLFQWLSRKRGGRLFWVEVSLKRIVIGGKDRMLAVVRDISERKRLQEQLIQSQKVEAIGRLAGGVAHDFNNLLTAISGYSDLLLSSLGEQDSLRKDIEEIKKAATKATSLTRQLLAFSRRQPLKAVVLDLNAVVVDMERMLRRIIGEDIEMVSKLEPALARVKADHGQIEQVIMNMVVNARDAMPRGGRLTVETENTVIKKDYSMAIPEASPGRFVCVSVTDMGAGMDRETIERIFDPFFSTKGPDKGAGLGLAIAYGIVKQHGGWINVYSEPGRGSVFKIYLPALAEGNGKRAGEEELSRQPCGLGEKILLVEDDEGFSKFIALALTENGYVVREAVCVKDGLSVFKANGGDFQLIVADMALPDGKGSQMVEQLLSIKPELRVVLVSGYPQQLEEEMAMSERGFRFLQKPCSLSDLLRAVGGEASREVDL